MVAARQVKRTVGRAARSLRTVGSPWALLQGGPSCSPSALRRRTPWGARGPSALRRSGAEGSGDVVRGGDSAEAPGPYILISAPSSAGSGRPAASGLTLPGALYVGQFRPPSPDSVEGKEQPQKTSAKFPPPPQVLDCDFPPTPSLGL